jgi:putative endonuclease
VSDPRRRRGRLANRAGQAAEDAVARHYEAQGWTVAARRWRAGGPASAGGGEIDLIMRRGGAVAFVEVKSGRAAATGRDAITPAQWARLEAAAIRYTVHAQTGDATLRFDAAFVGADGAIAVVENARETEQW